ncbi:MAG TPA: hypothetical protein VM219_04025 [Phycisphaerae bacterium]|nr:hypothetical protein [Phycisphaerae bacterium]
MFSMLYRWSYRQGENFTTDAFACLLGLLAQEEATAAIGFVSWLCFGDQQFTLGSIPKITTQAATGEGTPDMTIDSREILAFVEVKVGSGFGETQVERYSRLLRSQAAGRRKRLVLLTVDRPDDVSDTDLRCLRWHEVADHLLKMRLKVKSPVALFLTGEFVTFLKEQIMTIEHVGWQLPDGIAAMRNLIQMLGVALQAAPIPIYRRTAGWDWIGYYLGNNTGLWAGIRHSSPAVVSLEFASATADRKAFEALGRGEWNDGKPKFLLDLSSEAVHFFARSKESQLDLLTGFLRQAYADARSCVAKEGTVSDSDNLASG